MVKFIVTVPAPQAPHKVDMVFPQGMACETDDFQIMLGRLTYDQVMELGHEYTQQLLKNWSDQTRIPLKAAQHNYVYDLEPYEPKQVQERQTRRRK
jgi:S-ribosylhomocysteine lyase LuxS involved in autoinducer biosynthesis